MSDYGDPPKVRQAHHERMRRLCTAYAVRWQRVGLPGHLAGRCLDGIKIAFPVVECYQAGGEPPANWVGLSGSLKRTRKLAWPRGVPSRRIAATCSPARCTGMR